MAKPQNSPRGYFSKKRIDVGATNLTANSTGIIFSAAVFVGNQATVGKINANSTAILLPSTGFQMAALTSLKFTSNSTGIRIGTRYISTNTTSNSVT